MGNKDREKTKKLSRTHWVLLIVAALLLVALILVAVGLSRDKEPEVTEPTGQSDIKVELMESEPITLGQGLRISRVGKYTGIYMEDGSNEVVSGVLMVVLDNTTQQDLQLTRIALEYTDFTAEFEATNLPAGESVVLLERSRREAVMEEPQSAKLSNTVFFQEKMSLMEETFRISGAKNAITIENISGQDISGTIYVYYKNSATDLYYGGITYRAKLEGGLAAGETQQVLAGHYNSESCTILQVTVGG